MTPIQRQLLLPQGIVKNGLVAWYKMDEGSGQYIANSVRTGMSVTNIIANGNFANGTTGWVAQFSTFSAANNICTVTGDGSGTSLSIIVSPFSGGVVGHKYYVRAKMKVTDAVCTSFYVRFGGNTTGAEQATQNTPTQNQVYTVSGVLDTTSIVGTWYFTCRATYADAATANGKVMEVQEVLAIDLTALFGAGNEPTAGQCDVLFNTWFDGTVQRELPNYNGTLGSAVGADTNDPTWTAQGLTFGADDYVNCSAALSFTTGELTMIAAYTPNAGENTADLVYLKDGATRKFVLALYPLAGTKIEVDLLGSRVYGTSSVDALPTIACVSCKLPNTTIICKNGFTETVSNVITPSSFSATNIFIGGPTGIEGYFQGSIHCVLLYNRALSVGELKQNYRFIKKELAKRGVAVG